jgi:hypothetical protein
MPVPDPVEVNLARIEHTTHRLNEFHEKLELAFVFLGFYCKGLFCGVIELISSCVVDVSEGKEAG